MTLFESFWAEKIMGIKEVETDPIRDYVEFGRDLLKELELKRRKEEEEEWLKYLDLPD